MSTAVRRGSGRYAGAPPTTSPASGGGCAVIAEALNEGIRR
ncbi:hypothetical protein F4556_001240 [Kitasatospora gansuensis]|uniref:Uncharacterized protein n=1 Tax=Kitasatospora gansuensis TaxID=258050 RepID=A0A7W7WGK1_9ACTN|nr:hypothetical protein [Kitasatospora gansuensis]MBB4945705.1 hypothetical protein [Kitasatospora gansuensis]